MKDREQQKNLKALEQQVKKSLRLDQLSLRKKLYTLKKKKNPSDEAIADLLNVLEESQKKRIARQKMRPVIPPYPDLPIVVKRIEIIQTIRDNQVTILSGATGSGKTTQIPKFCLEAGRGIEGRIGCTQPRRIAATSVSSRIAEELEQSVGEAVGYKIRFSEKTSEDGYIKIMTDGVLLAETQQDPYLNEYDTLIIDEAHERSLNVDFLLGILKTLLKKRRDLKLVITSATIDTEKFAKAFNNAPIIEVSGRTYPVEVEYKPYQGEEELSLADQAIEGIEEIITSSSEGDVLVFMPTEADIRETIESLEKKNWVGTELLPLFARLSQGEQSRIFHPSVNRRIIVSTNVAETSLTIPGIRFVVDTGLARISQYSAASRTMSLPVSRISRSSADQRTGRAGRIEKGFCIRLYSEEDYENRDRFTPPEILRTNLSEVILRMISLRLTDIDLFPFIDRPTDKHVKDGYKLLLELKAILAIGGKGGDHNQNYRLTPEGRIMARLPLDPRHSRILLQAQKEGCLKDALIVVSALSIQDPRERPAEKEKEADDAHRKFFDPTSDFIFYIKLWEKVQEERKTSRGALRRFCRDNFLSHRRIREWMDIYRQIADQLKEEKFLINNSSFSREMTKETFSPWYRALHRALLSGFLSQIALQQKQEPLKGKRPNQNIYRTSGGREVMVFPGSHLFNKNKEWLFSGEMVKTGRLYARKNAAFDPDWLMDLGEHLIKTHYFDPFWSRKTGQVMSKTKSSLFGFPIGNGQAPYNLANPEEATEVFIQKALIEMDLLPQQLKQLPFLKANQILIDSLKNMEEKTRRRDLLVSDEQLLGFYKKSLKNCSDLPSLLHHIKNNGDGDLLLQEEDLLLKEKPEDLALLFPNKFTSGGEDFVLEYTFDPDSRKDGITLKVPMEKREEVNPFEVEYLVPGLLREKVLALLKALPKTLRKPLVPIPDKVDHLMPLLKDHSIPLMENLTNLIAREFSHHIPQDQWDQESLPEHLKMRISLTGSQGRELNAGRTGAVLQSTYKENSPRIAKIKSRMEEENITSWKWETFPEKIDFKSGKKNTITLYPALNAEENSVAFRLYLDPREARINHKTGVALLMKTALAHQVRALKKEMILPKELSPLGGYFGGANKVTSVLWDSILDCFKDQEIKSSSQWESFLSQAKAELPEISKQAMKTLETALGEYKATREIVLRAKARGGQFGINRLKELEDLFPSSFPQGYSIEELEDLTRYVRGLGIRTERGLLNPSKDKQKYSEIHPYWNEWVSLETSKNWSQEKQKAYRDYGWFLEEWKLNLFAPEIRSKGKVSAKRAKENWDKLKQMY